MLIRIIKYPKKILNCIKVINRNLYSKRWPQVKFFFFFFGKNMNKRLMLGTSIFVTHSVDLAQIISPSVKFMCFSCIWNIWLLYGHKVSHHYCLQCLLEERIHHSWRMKKVIFDHQDYLFYTEVRLPPFSFCSSERLSF